MHYALKYLILMLKIATISFQRQNKLRITTHIFWILSKKS